MKRTGAFTVCAGHGLTWAADREGSTVSVMTARQSAVLQGFPLAWKIPSGSRTGQRSVGTSMLDLSNKSYPCPTHVLPPHSNTYTLLTGNAMSVELSKAIVLAAISVQEEAQATHIIPQPTADPLPSGDKRSISSSEYRKCKKRMRALESADDELRQVLCKYTGASSPMDSP